MQLFEEYLCCNIAFVTAGDTPFSWTQEDVNNLYSSDVLMSSDGTLSFMHASVSESF